LHREGRVENFQLLEMRRAVPPPRLARGVREREVVILYREAGVASGRIQVSVKPNIVRVE